MGSPTLPIPGMGNDIQGSQASPLDVLRRISMMQQQPAATGTTSTQPAIPQPQPLHQPIPLQPGAQANQGEFQSKGAHQRASMQSLASTLQNTVAQAHNAMLAHENKIIQQKTDAYTHAMQGISQADSMLKEDPTNPDALKMKASNESMLKAMLDPTTPEGKKNIKLLTKAYGVQEGEQTPEQQAAQNSVKSVKKQADAAAMAQHLQSGQAFPQTQQLSPQTQLQAQMVQQGVAPKAATGTAMLNNATGAAKAGVQNDQKQRQMDIRMESLGLDPKTGQPIPIEQLPVQKQAQIQSARATDEYKQAQEQYYQAREKSLLDPNSPTNRAAMLNAEGRMMMGRASMIRGQVGMLNYEAGALGKDAQGNPLPGSFQVNGQTVGSRFAGFASKAMQQQAQFEDVSGQLKVLDGSIQAMKSAGLSMRDPRIAEALKHADQPFDQWKQGVSNSSMPPEMKEFVISRRGAEEQISGLRGLLRGSSSNASINRMVSTLPGASSDYEMSATQMKQIYGMLDRLEPGVPKVNLPGQSGQKTTEKPTDDLNKALDF